MKIQGYGIILKKDREYYLSSFFAFRKDEAKMEFVRLDKEYKAKVVEVEMRTKDSE